jgi:5-methylcytosine-specific restriction endonuclease McrA
MRPAKLYDRIPYPSKTLVFRRDQQKCAYCGEVFSEAELTRDHIIPESKGGTTTWSNLVSACKRCNHYKGDHLLDTITDMELLYEPYIPSRNERIILANRKILDDQFKYLIANVPAHSRLHLPAEEPVVRRRRCINSDMLA